MHILTLKKPSATVSSIFFYVEYTSQTRECKSHCHEYKEWFFFRSLDERIERDGAEIKTTHGTPTRDSIKEIAEKIYSMLSEDD